MSLLGRQHFTPRNGPRISFWTIDWLWRLSLAQNFFSKVFRLHAILHDAAGAVYLHNGKEPGYSYKIGRGPNSCLLGHVTGLLYCLYLKLFVPSIFNLVDF